MSGAAGPERLGYAGRWSATDDVETLEGAHKVLEGMVPGLGAPLEVWREFWDRSARLFARVAESDPDPDARVQAGAYARLTRYQADHPVAVTHADMVAAAKVFVPADGVWGARLDPEVERNRLTVRYGLPMLHAVVRLLLGASSGGRWWSATEIARSAGVAVDSVRLIVRDLLTSGHAELESAEQAGQGVLRRYRFTLAGSAAWEGVRLNTSSGRKEGKRGLQA